MKKILAVLSILLVVMSLSACAPKKATYEIAMITDKGDIDDKSFNQGAWEGVKKYAEDNKKTYKYYKPTEISTAAYVAAIDLAVSGGAKIVVTPGFLFEPAILVVQEKYPNVKFVLLDGFPNNQIYTADYKEKITSNTYSIFYREEQSGFLAGYAAVKEGFTSLGFMGGMAVPAVVRFGYGFLQGAEYAAIELGLTSVNVKYFYTGDFADTPANQQKAAAWYAAGVEVIFAAGGKVGNSVMSAAAAAGKKVIGVDVDQSAESPTVISSATKGLGASVILALDSFYKNKFPGGTKVSLGADVNGIGLPQNFAKFTKFNKAAYDAIFAKLVSNSIDLKDNADAATADLLGLTKVIVTLEN
ncbi:MAG: basic membrane lipoprotein [Erysipelotrichaceae bacterium]|nr:MAG: basic membrane [Erysipelotrichaceae bacterium]TXT17375.1 MAG: basic membrane lipoprotein [Erysipelotrichaceae bacterium]